MVDFMAVASRPPVTVSLIQAADQKLHGSAVETKGKTTPVGKVNKQTGMKVFTVELTETRALMDASSCTSVHLRRHHMG